MNANYLDEHGASHPIVMGSYGFGVSRMLAAIAEATHDERGLCWPISVSPFEVHLVGLGADAEVRSTADSFYTELRQRGVDVLFDDRDESPGVKFADADLIGVPLRLTISARSLKSGGVEVKRRADAPSAAHIVALDSAFDAVVAELNAIRSESPTV